jgi:hypothetical protein
MRPSSAQPDPLEQAARIVARALELCAERSGWTKRALARDRWGHPVPVISPRAVRFCAQGALIKAACEVLDVEIPTSTELAAEWTPEMEEPSYPDALQLAFRVCGAECVPLLQQVLEVTIEDELPLLRTSDGRTQGPLPWSVLVSGFNDAVSHKAAVAILEAASRDFESALQRRRGESGRRKAGGTS